MHCECRDSVASLNNAIYMAMMTAKFTSCTLGERYKFIDEMWVFNDDVWKPARSNMNIQYPKAILFGSLYILKDFW